MRFVVLDSTSIPGIKSGPGSPAYFSRFTIEYLTQQLGHEVVISDHFDAKLCASADVVWAEWTTVDAFEAAASGVCKRLVLKLKGFDVHGPLDQLAWQNVDALVYESNHVKALAWNSYPVLEGIRCQRTIPSGLDVSRIPFKNRGRGKVVGFVGRTVSDKGHQLAYEWARQHPLYELHMVCSLADRNPRFMGYLKHAKPKNVTLYETVADPVWWLDAIGANYFLSTSIQEAPGYAIAEAAALGIKPLIHDGPGIDAHWPPYLTWRSLADLDRLMAGPYDSAGYRAVVEEELDSAKLSRAFAGLIMSLPERDTSAAAAAASVHAQEELNDGVVESVIALAHDAVDDPSADMERLDRVVTEFRSRIPLHGTGAEHRYGAALTTACAFFNHGDLERAEMWACRALLDFVRPDAMALLGEIALGRNDLPAAQQALRAACVLDNVDHPYKNKGLTDRRFERLEGIARRMRAATT